MINAGIALALTFAVLMAVASLFTKRGLQYARAELLLLTSLVVATPLFVGLAALAADLRTIPPEAVVLVVLTGISGSAVARLLNFQAIRFVGPGKALSIIALSPLFVAGLSALFLGEPVTAAVLGGTVIIVGGVVALMRDARAEVERTNRSPLVLLWPLGAAIVIALTVTVRKVALNSGIDPLLAGAINMVTALVVVAPIVLTRYGDELRTIDPRALRDFTIASVLMGVGFVSYFLSLQITPANVFFPLIQTQPVFAVALSAAFLGDLEVVTRRSLVAALLIAGGAIVITLG